MMKYIAIIVASLLLAFALNAQEETIVEVKLIAALEEDRGWCLDMRGRRDNANPIGGLHGHSCDSYAGVGMAADQGYVLEDIKEKNQFRLAVFEDICITVYEPLAGSFASMETCDGRNAQQLIMDEEGHIRPKVLPGLCLTMHPVIQPGGGGTPLHIMRDVTFEACDQVRADLQRWELREEWTGPEEATLERPYAANPNAAPPPGMGGGMGMGMGGQQ